MLERDIQRKIIKALRERGAYVATQHQSGYGVAGVPDLLVAWQGRFIGMEVKRPGGKATAAQAHQIELIQAAGSVAGIVTCVEDALAMLKQAEEGHTMAQWPRQ